MTGLAGSFDGAFADPAIGSARAFRQIMEAMARPGEIRRVDGAAPPAPLSPAAGAVLLTLCDIDTPLYLAGAADTDEIRAWIAFHTGAPPAPRGAAAFAVGRWQDLLPLSGYPVGTPENPDRSATLIVELDLLDTAGATLRGPGIKETAQLGLPETDAFRRNRAAFPLGLDFILTAGDRLAALPRSTEVL